VAVGGGWIGGRVVRTEALASAPAGEGCRWCTEAPLILLFLYLYTAFELQHAKLLLAF
jgi:hypothetical protein